jgi:dolichyl-phosphate-mannose--protein O-mannosyl transferase
VTAIAAVLRLIDLGRPHVVIFDETYYVKDGLALLRYGYEREAIKDADKTILGATDTSWRAMDVFKDSPSFVVHPPVGKWVIATGEWAFGVNPFGWRIAVAVLGILSVLMTARIVRRMTRSDFVGTLAGFLLAIEGLHFVMSRTALLDMSLMFFCLAAFGLLILDRDAVRRRAQMWMNLWDGQPVRVGPGFGLRPWRIAAGVALGLACGVKWSGLWYVAVLGLLAVSWDFQVRRALGVRRPLLGMLARDAVPAFLSLVVVGFAVYVATWSGWLVTSGGYDRNWAASHPGPTWIPEALRSLAEYHRAAWHFHVGLNVPHSYRSHAWGWPVMARPTSFYYESPTGCGSDRCSAEVISLANPIIWWAGLFALGHQIWRWLAARDWRSGALVAGYVAGIAPWLIYHNRTIFTFYSIVFTPYLVAMLSMSLAALPGGPDASRNRRFWGTVALGSVVLLAVVACWFFYPIWTGKVITFDQWHWRMWMPTWV